MDSVSALERGFLVLDCFAAARRPLGNGEVAQHTGIPRATVSRLIATLVGLGHLRPAATRDEYELGAGLVRLAQTFLGAIDVRHFARPHLVALAEASGASAFIGIRDGDEMLVIEAARSRSAALLLGADVGTRMQIAASALGRAWLAAVDEPTRRALIDRWRNNPALLTHAGARLDEAIDEARRSGHAVSLGEWHPNIHAVAVPIRTASGEVISMNCGGAAFVLPEERLRQVVLPQVLRAAQALAADIGGVAGLEPMHLRHGATPAAAPAVSRAPPAPPGRRRVARASRPTRPS